MTAQEEWRAHWPMVLAATAGLSLASMAVYAIGLFIDPLHQEFGWSRAQISSGLSLVALVVVPLSPIVGGMIDRWGSRRLAIPGVIFCGISFALFGLANGSTSQWLALWGVYALVAVTVKATVWTAAVSSVFVASRGLALAAALSGAAIAQTLAPLLALSLIDRVGWRLAFVWMGAAWSAVVLLLVVFFFFDAHDLARRKTAMQRAAESNLVATGLTLKQALRNGAILKIAAALFIATALGVGITVHKVPILTASGITREVAAMLAASAGAAGIIGKLLTGWMLDRWKSGWIPGISVSLPAIAYVALLQWAPEMWAVSVAMLIFGYSAGAYLQVCTYLTSRYGGLRHFGMIFGVMASLMSLATSIGPVLIGAIYDEFGSYRPALIGCVPIALLAGLLVGRLGPYPEWTSANREQTTAE